MDTGSPETPHEDVPQEAAPGAESSIPPNVQREDAPQPAPPEDVPEPVEPATANVVHRRTDQVALALLAGIVVLLLICVAIALIAWRHAPVNPAMPAAFWPVLQ